MKFFKILYVIPTFFGFSTLQQSNLEGRYKIFFENEYHSQNGVISFNIDSYKRTLTNKKNISGTIEYKKNKVILNDENSSLQMELSKSEIDKDTISFRTLNSNKKVEESDIIMYEGILVKLK